MLILTISYKNNKRAGTKITPTKNKQTNKKLLLNVAVKSLTSDFQTNAIIIAELVQNAMVSISLVVAFAQGVCVTKYRAASKILLLINLRYNWCLLSLLLHFILDTPLTVGHNDLVRWNAG